MGSGETGISNNLIKDAHHFAKIPIMGEIGSLNVSISAGVILYEAAGRDKGSTIIPMFHRINADTITYFFK
jgi:tRNA G18 (ribose-2'-O)-methylase SpoU